ncbi:YkvA family protein [Aquabacter spiritensis]|uniref:Uncharacterized membrane protein YkvA (DUF1232 family) n=1 Tax=Aquabacter spiritensis TaxID=933073 RepID=A0A4V2UXP9_9HYPH|nr:YkvA family protein [Aquabacter spiritensis]TCT04328.1 uncharacterized membrane protein YkvA (DUF1232 family) [Aquabacter spiritensis]
MTHTDPINWSTLGADEKRQAEQDERKVRRGFWSKLRRHAAAVPFAEDAVAAYYAAFDRATPLRVRAGLMGALAYFLVPTDVMPDFLPVLGFGDDAAVLFGAIQMLSASILPHHRAAARAAIDDLDEASAAEGSARV